MSRHLPAAKDVRDLLEDLLGRTVTVGSADPLRAADLVRTLSAIYVDDSLRMAAVVGMDLPLAVWCGAALGLIPPGGAADSIEEGVLAPNLAENVAEVCNVLGGLINRDGGPHLRLYQTYQPGQPAPSDASGVLLALGRRLDLAVDIAAYGSGRLAITLAA